MDMEKYLMSLPPLPIAAEESIHPIQPHEARDGKTIIVEMNKKDIFDILYAQNINMSNPQYDEKKLEDAYNKIILSGKYYPPLLCFDSNKIHGTCLNFEDGKHSFLALLKFDPEGMVYCCIIPENKDWSTDEICTAIRSENKYVNFIKES